jgi:adenylate kinase
VPDETATQRLLGRARAEGRTDDTPDVIARRLAIYHDETEPLVEYYRARDVLVPLHAERSVDEVYAELQDALEQLQGRAA